QAQEWRAPNRVLKVSAQPAGAGTRVSVSAESAVGRAQNWQDGDGFHLVLPNTVAADSLKTVRGVKVSRVGSSLEVLFQTKPGSTVNVQTDGNEITLLVDRKLEAVTPEHESRGDSRPIDEPQLFANQTNAQQVPRDSSPLSFSSPVSDLASKSRQSSGEIAHSSSNWNPPIGPTSALPAQSLPQRDAATAPGVTEEVAIQPEDEGAL